MAICPTLSFFLSWLMLLAFCFELEAGTMPALDVAAQREPAFCVVFDGERVLRLPPAASELVSTRPLPSSDSLELIDMACCDYMFRRLRCLFDFAAMLADWHARCWLWGVFGNGALM